MKTVLKFISLLIIAASVLSLFSGCENYDAKAIIYYNVNESPANIDPQSASTPSELLIVRNLFEGLLRVNEDGEIVNGVASDYDYNEESLKYTFDISESATWYNGDRITAYDFVFAFRRAVDPKTGCPFTTKFLPILNAEQIIHDGVDPEFLGVKALNDLTLEISLKYNDQNFLYNLTTSAFMPCNETFFDGCAGKYGLSKSDILTNGSYYLAKWSTEEFAARLYKSDKYFGGFPAKNGGVFLSSSKDKDSLELLKSSSVDIAEINMADTDYDSIGSAGFKTIQFENICWVLKFSDSMPFEARKALILGIDRTYYAGDLGVGYNVSYSFFPDFLVEESVDRIGIPNYDLEFSKQIFRNAMNNYDDGKLPTTTITYYNDNGIKKTVNDIVGSWQQNLGAYLNIQPVSDANQIQRNLNENLDMISIFPVYILDRDINSYIYQYGITNITSKASALQEKLTVDYMFAPLAFQNSVYAYSTELTNISAGIGNGNFDFAYFTKK